jgi:hypothetical protein
MKRCFEPAPSSSDDGGYKIDQVVPFGRPYPGPTLIRNSNHISYVIGARRSGPAAARHEVMRIKAGTAISRSRPSLITQLRWRDIWLC